MNHTHVFVCGQHRSGTSVLARSLRHHPQVSGFQDTGAVEDEGQFLQSVYPPAFCYGGAGLFGFDRRSHLDETSSLVSAESASKLRAEWSRYWDVNCPILLEKSPPNLVRTRFLQSLFPDARFVVLLRHPIPVSLSTKSGRRRIPLVTLIEHWLICHERFLADCMHLNRVHVLWYEDLVERPEAVLNEIWRFLGIEPVPPAESIRSHNARYLARWDELCRSAWSRAYVNWICRRFEARVATFGYSLVEPACVVPKPLVGRTDRVFRPSFLSSALAGGTAIWERVARGPLRAPKR